MAKDWVALFRKRGDKARAMRPKSIRIDADIFEEIELFCDTHGLAISVVLRECTHRGWDFVKEEIGEARRSSGA